MKYNCLNCNSYVDLTYNKEFGSLVCGNCGEPLKNEHLVSGVKVGDYIIEEEIGREPFYTIYKAFQINLERMVVLKVLNSSLSKDKDFVRKFFREAQIAGQVNCSHVVQIYDAGEHENLCYIALEIFEGESLEQMIRRIGTLNSLTAVEIAIKVARSLQYFWNHEKMIHGDLRPENILVNSSGDVKIVDMGILQSVKRMYVDQSKIVYFAPEVNSNTAISASFKQDMYSFGAVIYEMLNGFRPYYGYDTAEIKAFQIIKKPVSLSEIFSGFNEELSDFVDGLLNADPEKRPDNWDEVVHRLSAIQHKLKENNEDLTESVLNFKATESLKIPVSMKNQKRKIYYLIAVLSLIIGVLAFFVLGSMVGHNFTFLNFSGNKNRELKVDQQWDVLKSKLYF